MISSSDKTVVPERHWGRRAPPRILENQRALLLLAAFPSSARSNGAVTQTAPFTRHTSLIFCIFANDVITYSSSKPGVIFIKNEDEAKLPSWRKNKVAFIEFLLCTYHLCQPRKYVILFSLFKWGGGVWSFSNISISFQSNSSDF